MPPSSPRYRHLHQAASQHPTKRDDLRLSRAERILIRPRCPTPKNCSGQRTRHSPLKRDRSVRETILSNTTTRPADRDAHGDHVGACRSDWTGAVDRMICAGFQAMQVKLLRGQFAMSTITSNAMPSRLDATHFERLGLVPCNSEIVVVSRQDSEKAPPDNLSSVKEQASYISADNQSNANLCSPPPLPLYPKSVRHARRGYEGIAICPRVSRGQVLKRRLAPIQPKIGGEPFFIVWFTSCSRCFIRKIRSPSREDIVSLRPV
jgi:hypothetical protein